jgi:hypothetical protein
MILHIVYSPLYGNHSKAGPINEGTAIAEVGAELAKGFVCFPKLGVRLIDDVGRHD